MKKAVTVSLIVVGSVYFYFCVEDYFEEKAIRQARVEERKALERRKIDEVLRMIARTGAVSDWDMQLVKGETYSFKQIFTVELEKVWVQDSPIFFYGGLYDVKRDEQGRLLVSINVSGIFPSTLLSDELYGALNRERVLIFEDLRLSLVTDESKIGSILSAGLSLEESILSGTTVAVVAKINFVKVILGHGHDEVARQIRVGEGELVDIVHISDGL